MTRGHKCDYKRQIREELLDDAVAEVIVKLVRNPRFADMMQQKINNANKADLLNVALFGRTAKQWRDANPGRKGNIRDDADLNQLLVLANMESYNAVLIGQGKKMSERLVLMRELAVKQMKFLSLASMDSLKQLPERAPK